MASLRAKVEGDRAFERLYRKYVSDVYRYSLALVRSEADAEDVTQTTFLNAFRAYQRGERPRKAKSWLLAIAHNVCRQRFRHQSRRPQEVELDEDLAEATVPEEGPTADDLVRALQQLSFNQRSALVMRELEGRPYAEIGEILELPVSAVETLLFRARRALREQLENAITCREAEQLFSLQLDGQLGRAERGTLRAHLRSCPDCARTARSQRAQRAAWKSLAVVPLPGSLSSLLGGGGTAAVGIGTGVALKVAALGATAALVGGGTYEGVRHAQSTRHEASPTAGAAIGTQTRGATSTTPSAHLPSTPGAGARGATTKVKSGVGHGQRGVGHRSPHQVAPVAPEERTKGIHGFSGQHAGHTPAAVPGGQAKKTAPNRKAGHGVVTAPGRAKTKKRKTKATTRVGKRSTKHSSTGGTTAKRQRSTSTQTKPRPASDQQQAAPAANGPNGGSGPADHSSKR